MANTLYCLKPKNKIRLRINRKDAKYDVQQNLNCVNGKKKKKKENNCITFDVFASNLQAF